AGRPAAAGPGPEEAERVTRPLSSAPTPEYGAPNLPITTTRRTDVNTTPRDDASSKPPLEIPTFDRTWHPNEITGWLSNLECEENVSEADLARARQAVSEALGVGD
ncbi:hypothetical protein ACFWOX_39930, partial [Streptomyces sp. NPDC058467]|uniref:hypothetical protein n=1 Tax=Streptomyces sp. NPDC058467 TaxID=3346513 RepID=UPI0036545F16